MIERHPDITQIYLEGKSLSFEDGSSNFLIICLNSDTKDMAEDNFKGDIILYLSDKYEALNEGSGSVYWVTREQLSGMYGTRYDMERSIVADDTLVYDVDRGGF